MLTSISVRTRIIVLALIPVLGFVTNGLTYISGERDVGAAFDTFKQSATLADASRDFKSAIAAVRIIVKDFSANPSDNLVVSFDASACARGGEPRHHRRLDRPQPRRKHRGPAQGHHGTAQYLHRPGARPEDPRLRRNLGTYARTCANAGNAVERIINENMTWVAEADASKLMMTLMLMRELEAEYRLTQSDLTKQQFFVAYKKFTDTFALIDGTPEMKDALEHEVKTYADTFAKWIDGYDRVQPLRAVIDIDSQNMLPRADDIIERATRARGRGIRRPDRVAGRIPAPASSRSASPWSRSASVSVG